MITDLRHEVYGRKPTKKEVGIFLGAYKHPRCSELARMATMMCGSINALDTAPHTCYQIIKSH